MMLYLNIMLVVGASLLAPGHTQEEIRILRPLCRPDLCPNSEVHVGCFNKVGIFVVNVDGRLKEDILDAFNMMRNYVASGVGNLSAAARMPMLAWDADLQRLADLQVGQFSVRRFCANTEKYHYVATTEIRGSIDTSQTLSDQILRGFLSQVFHDLQGCRMDSQNRIRPMKQGTCVGHYIPLIEDRGNRMGCALSLQYIMWPWLSVATLICHFSRANVNSLRHYEVSETPAEKCLTGTSQRFQFLCSNQEMVDANSLLGDPVVSLVDDVASNSTKPSA